MEKMQCDFKATLDRIRQLQHERSMTDAELARQIGVARQDIYKLFNRRTTLPKLEWFISLSQLFDVSIDELIVLRPWEDD